MLGLAVTLLLAVGAGVASAHVTVNPNTVTAGSYAKLTFRVPTESDTASTVSVTVSLPTDHPFPSVSVMQLPGWTAAAHRRTFDPPVTQGRFTLTDAVDSITWTAADKVGIRPGEFAEFAISVGPVPEVPTMTFPAVQTYSDGSVVRWDQPRGADGGEPQHPAPLLTITGAGSTAAPSGAGSGPTVTGVDQPGGSAVTASAPDGTARILAVVALVLAGAALLIAALGMRRRRPAPSGRAHASVPPSPPAGSSPTQPTQPTQPTPTSPDRPAQDRSAAETTG